MQTSDKSFKVLIIGAGMAGLAAANQLTAAGYNATILESRDRSGGRTWTTHALGVPFDLGASWLHGLVGNPVAELAKELELPLYYSDFANYLFIDESGTLVTRSKLLNYKREIDIILKNAGDYARAAPHDMDLSSALNATVNPRLHSMQWQDYYTARMQGLSAYVGADFDLFSAREWDQEEFLEGGNHLMAAGYAPIIEKLTKNCRIELNTQVKQIIYRENQVEVLTNRGKWQANAVIITLPLGVLKKDVVTFDPLLPHAKQNALKRLDMGNLNRIAIKFPNLFWLDDYFCFKVFAQHRHTIPYFINYHPIFNSPILVGMVGGKLADELEALDDNAVIEVAMASLQHYFGNDIPRPIAYQMTRWRQDPFSYGAYSYLPVGATGKDYIVLGEPVDNCLFFAGEATNRQFPGTAHGAYLSGVREAERIIQLHRIG